LQLCNSTGYPPKFYSCKVDRDQKVSGAQREQGQVCGQRAAWL